jgi:hypothetical protein
VGDIGGRGVKVFQENEKSGDWWGFSCGIKYMEGAIGPLAKLQEIK